ncbi:hypothetical protein TUM4637_20750 [Shewanella hafniensis]|nr:hypothetical protein TUM4637_20750 [Shewanella hafniensis]
MLALLFKYKGAPEFRPSLRRVYAPLFGRGDFSNITDLQKVPYIKAFTLKSLQFKTADQRSEITRH